MGCDIHLHVELKRGDTNEWVHYSAPFVSRRYWLFAIMAGVRNYDNVTPISNPKGLPEDISLITKVDYERWGNDAHSGSWLDNKEILELDRQISKLDDYNWSDHDLEYGILHTYLFGNAFAAFIEDDSYKLKPFTDVRFVFWFDC